MAYSVVETRVSNPAGKKENMARKKLSAKQIKYFGTPQQKAAQKRNRSNAAKKHVKTHAVKKHGARTLPNGAHKKALHKKQANPGPEILSLVMGNLGTKGKNKTMASKKYTKKAASKKTNAGYHKAKKKNMTHHKKRNPAGLGRPMDWVKGGVGVIGGGVGTRVFPQLLGTTNTGGVGYMLNAGTAILLSWATHAFTKDAVLTASVAAGGFAALILRIVGDLTPYGQALSLSGFGDYMVSNWVTPQRIINPNSAQFEIPSGWGTMPEALPPAGMMAQSGADARTSGNSY